MPTREQILQLLEGVKGGVLGPRPNLREGLSRDQLRSTQIEKNPNPQGIWQVLAQLARHRGNTAAMDFAQQQELADRDLKTRIGEGQLRGMEMDDKFREAQIGEMQERQARLKEDSEFNRSARQYDLLQKSSGTELGTTGRAVAPEIDEPGSIKPIRSPIYGPEMVKQNPEVEFPGGVKLRPPTREALVQEMMDRIKFQQEQEALNSEWSPGAVDQKIRLEEAKNKNGGTSRGLQQVAGMDENGQPYGAVFDPNTGTYTREGRLVPNFKPYRPPPGSYFPEVNEAGQIQRYFNPKTGDVQQLDSPGSDNRRNALELGLREKLSHFQILDTMINQLKEISNKVHTRGAEDGILGPPGARIIGAARERVNRYLGYDTDVKILHSKVGALAQIARQMGERGVLTEGDTARAAAMLPLSATATREEAQALIAEWEDIIDSSRRAAYQAAGRQAPPKPGSGTVGPTPSLLDKLPPRVQDRLRELLERKAGGPQ